ncbi:MAG: hypothetical protein SGBAC_008280 [Bacillariaceae sp.]
MESVSEFLESRKSDSYLLGTKNFSKQSEEERASDDNNKKANKEDGKGQLFECKQPVVDFMGLKLQPVFLSKVLRVAQGHVVVSLEDSRTDIVKASRNPANRALTSILESSTFEGESVFRVRPSSTTLSDEDDTIDGDENCMLSIELRLTLIIPLPSYMPIPPGFNSLGSAIVRQTGKSRTKKLLERLQEAYYDYHCEEEEKAQSLATTKKYVSGKPKPKLSLSSLFQLRRGSSEDD